MPISFSSLASLVLVRTARSPTAVALVVCPLDLALAGLLRRRECQGECLGYEAVDLLGGLGQFAVGLALRELTGNERIRAQFEGMRSRYSSQIKRGIATTLALLGSRPPILRGAAVPVSGAAAEVVWPILRSANSDATPRTWTAVSEVLSLLAEAAPEAVLDSLRTCLSGSHPFRTGDVRGRMLR